MQHNDPAVTYIGGSEALSCCVASHQKLERSIGHRPFGHKVVFAKQCLSCLRACGHDHARSQHDYLCEVSWLGWRSVCMRFINDFFELVMQLPFSAALHIADRM